MRGPDTDNPAGIGSSVAGLCLSQIKSGHIDDAIRRGLGVKEYALPSQWRAIEAHATIHSQKKSRKSAGSACKQSKFVQGCPLGYTDNGGRMRTFAHAGC
jgi:hypothetical protein